MRAKTSLQSQPRTLAAVLIASILERSGTRRTPCSVVHRLHDLLRLSGRMPRSPAITSIASYAPHPARAARSMIVSRSRGAVLWLRRSGSPWRGIRGSCRRLSGRAAETGSRQALLLAGGHITRNQWSMEYAKRRLEPSQRELTPLSPALDRLVRLLAKRHAARLIEATRTRNPRRPGC